MVEFRPSIVNKAWLVTLLVMLNLYISTTVVGSIPMLMYILWAIPATFIFIAFKIKVVIGVDGLEYRRIGSRESIPYENVSKVLMEDRLRTYDSKILNYRHFNKLKSSLEKMEEHIIILDLKGNEALMIPRSFFESNEKLLLFLDNLLNENNRIKLDEKFKVLLEVGNNKAK